MKGDGVSCDDVHCGSSTHAEMRECKESDRGCSRGIKIEIQGVCVGESGDDVEDGRADLRGGLGAGGEENQSLSLSLTPDTGKVKIELEDMKRMHMLLCTYV